MYRYLVLHHYGPFSGDGRHNSSVLKEQGSGRPELIAFFSIRSLSPVVGSSAVVAK